MTNNIKKAISDIKKIFDNKELIDDIYDNIKLYTKSSNEEIYIKWNEEWILFLTIFISWILNNNQDIDHFHFDEYNWLEKWSIELIVEKNNK